MLSSKIGRLRVAQGFPPKETSSLINSANGEWSTEKITSHLQQSQGDLGRQFPIQAAAYRRCCCSYNLEKRRLRLSCSLASRIKSRQKLPRARVCIGNSLQISSFCYTMFKMIWGSSILARLCPSQLTNLGILDVPSFCEWQVIHRIEMHRTCRRDWLLVPDMVRQRPTSVTLGRLSRRGKHMGKKKHQNPPKQMLKIG